MFMVTDTHGNRDTFDTIAQARAKATQLMCDYEDGFLGSDPKPVIMELRSIERYFYDKGAKEIARITLC
jgi:hypothetical protein